MAKSKKDHSPPIPIFNRIEDAEATTPRPEKFFLQEEGQRILMVLKKIGKLYAYSAQGAA
ncbi:hypothetical protein GYA13_03130 [Candidatus Kuenenbacteria bacterium]|nr:hypothetical protein [Candidatus Kuenenbacteria bacterium]